MMDLTKYTGDAAWVAMTISALAAVASQQDWSSRKGMLVGLGLCFAALGAALKSPPSGTGPKP